LASAYQAAAHGVASPGATMRSKSPSPRASSRVTPPPAVGSNAVAIAPAVAGEPHAQQVAALLRAYFGSINSRDYGGYTRLFIPQMRESAQHFNAGYASTVDSGAMLDGLTATESQGLAATVTFTSRQNPADSPNHSACDKWTIVLPLTPAGGGYLITHSSASYHPTVQACA
jgi:hypothetical protein